MRIRHAERQFELREREWERDEKEKERRRNVDREKEKERERLRKRLIKEQEEGADEEARKKAKRRGDYDEHRRRQKEKEDDEYDRLREQEEIAEAKQRKSHEEYEKQVRRRLAEIAEKDAAAKAAAVDVIPKSDGAKEPEAISAVPPKGGAESTGRDMNGANIEAPKFLSINQEAANAPVTMDVDEKRSISPAQKKLGFGLIGSGKRAIVPSVFGQEDEEEAPKERAIRELVPIDYTVEEMQAVSSFKANITGITTAPNLAAAADYAKSLSNLNNSREEQDFDNDKGRRQIDKSRSKDKDYSARDGQNDGYRDTVAKLDTKQLIDTIPKTKDELFAYQIDWKIYDQHHLHERMKPWIEKKILEFLGEEEDTLVEFIVTNTRKHTGAAEMLALLTTILDDEAEMFVMKLWRMLIFEVKKIETGLSSRSRS
ncbi:hypothetical protein KP509_06G082400 [Ceratopteris richardii]|nr:hypothetical protein KP509_06G082400 [Ceratopteris richardii]